MKVKIVINTMEMVNADQILIHRTAEVFEGELDIMPKGEYLTKISIIAEGIEHPICDVPFSPMAGYWQWVPPLVDDEILETIEDKVIENTEGI